MPLTSSQCTPSHPICAPARCIKWPIDQHAHLHLILKILDPLHMLCVAGSTLGDLSSQLLSSIPMSSEIFKLQPQFFCLLCLLLLQLCQCFQCLQVAQQLSLVFFSKLLGVLLRPPQPRAPLRGARASGCCLKFASPCTQNRTHKTVLGQAAEPCIWGLCSWQICT